MNKSFNVVNLLKNTHFRSHERNYKAVEKSIP